MGLFDKDIAKILKRYLGGRASQREETLVDEYYSLYDKHPANNSLDFEEKETLKAQMWAQIDRQTTRSAPRLVWLRYAAAACVVAGFSVVFFQTRKKAQPAGQLVQKVHPIVPGGPRASILLADGSRVDLADAPRGAIATQDRIALNKVSEGLLTYTPAQPAAQSAQGPRSTQNAQSAATNILSTPRGGVYQVIMADGTHVWLDAASSLKYNPANQPRTVDLTGRAYFEIAPRPGQPFKVRYKDQLLEVLGTHFNIDCYTDKNIQTTVLQGKIRLTPMMAEDSVEKRDAQPVELLPGEQATLAHGRLVIAKVDTNTAIAWKNNVFSFTNADIRDVLKEAARWYDIDVVYDTDIPEQRIDGNPSRDLRFTDFIKIISLTGLHFSVQGDTLHVSK